MNTNELEKELRDLSGKVERHERYLWVAIVLLGATGITGSVLISNLNTAHTEIDELTRKVKESTVEITNARNKAISDVATAANDETNKIMKIVTSQDFIAKAREGMLKEKEAYYISFAESVGGSASGGVVDLNLFGWGPNGGIEEGRNVVVSHGHTHYQKWVIEK
jgi:hypothetical protein